MTGCSSPRGPDTRRSGSSDRCTGENMHINVPSLLAFGSWMKLCPLRQLGGSSPVQACLRHSIMVWGVERDRIEFASALGRAGGQSQGAARPAPALTVFPAPLWPTMRHRGLENVMTAGSRTRHGRRRCRQEACATAGAATKGACLPELDSGLKDRMPRISIFSIVHILARAAAQGPGKRVG